MKELIQRSIEKSISYAEYFQEVEALVEAGKTSGPNQSESLAEYTKLGFQRMKKWEKITRLSPETIEQIQGSGEGYTWLILVEAWCGDVGQNLPAIHKLALAAGANLRVIYRDENLELMDQFLTNGGRSIPKLLIINDANMEVVQEWGPRPSFIQNWFMEQKKKEDFNKMDAMEYMHTWYAKNKQVALQEEFVKMSTQDL